MNVKFKKLTSMTLTVLLLFFYVAYPALSFAQEVTPAPTETTVDNSATEASSADTSSNTGDNTINPTESPSPTPSPTPNDINADTALPRPTPTDPPPPDTTSGQNATESSTLTSSSTEAPPTQQNSTNQDNGTAEIQTGDAVSVTTGDNDINTTSINSKVVNQTINIFVTENGNINLSDPFAIAAQAVTAFPDTPVINVSATNINNFGYLDINIVSTANTGDNSVNGAPSAVINTGNAYSIVSLINKVNFTVVNSEIHVITINLFGKLNGNIILPDMNQTTNCSGCGISLNASNSATVTNNLSSSSDTGNNSITGSGDASVTTGDAQSLVNNLDIVNTNFVGVNVQALYITNFGDWDGNFIGWGDFDPRTGGASMIFYNITPNGSGGGGGPGCASCTGQLTVSNNASVFNNITSSANTGGNSIDGGSGSITTGTAYSAISLINFINSTFLNSVGFFGFINIFGNWTGNIGGASEFEALETDDNQSPPIQENNVLSNSSSASNTKEEGGQLAVTNTNNVGEFVYPGDTVTFFEKVKNTGTGKVYEAKLNLYLIYNGKIAGGTSFPLGDIEAGHAVNVNTGFVLSNSTPGGNYVARAYVTGNIGPDNEKVSATADSNFLVKGNVLYSSGGEEPKETANVLGASYPPAVVRESRADYNLWLFLAAVISAYITLKTLREKEKFVMIFSKKITLEQRVKALRMFLV